MLCTGGEHVEGTAGTHHTERPEPMPPCEAALCTSHAHSAADLRATSLQTRPRPVLTINQRWPLPFRITLASQTVLASA